jgi:hypothetical protein
MGERPYGGELWILNMTVLRVGGVLMRFMGRVGRGSRRILRGVGGSFLATLDLRWGMTSKFDSCMIFGVGITFFLDLFSIARFKDTVVVGHLELSSAFHQWNINFLRVVHDEEIELFTSLFILLYSIRLR